MSPAAVLFSAGRAVSPASSSASSGFLRGALKREFDPDNDNDNDDHDLDPDADVDADNDNDDPAQANLTPSNKRAKPMSAERIARLEARQARNRASAQASRDKKKAFFGRLEVEHRMLVQENAWLKGQNQHLYQAIIDFEKRLQMAESVIDVLTSNSPGAGSSASTSPAGGHAITLAQAQAIAQTQIAAATHSSEPPHVARSLSMPHAHAHNAAAPAAAASRAFPPSLAGEFRPHAALSGAAATLATPPAVPSAMAHYFAPALDGGLALTPSPSAPGASEPVGFIAPTELSALSSDGRLSPQPLPQALPPRTEPAAVASPAQLMTGSISASSIASSLGEQTAVGDWEREYTAHHHHHSPHADKAELVDGLLAAHAPPQGLHPHHPHHHMHNIHPNQHATASPGSSSSASASPNSSSSSSPRSSSGSSCAATPTTCFPGNAFTVSMRTKLPFESAFNSPLTPSFE